MQNNDDVISKLAELMAISLSKQSSDIRSIAETVARLENNNNDLRPTIVALQQMADRSKRNEEMLVALTSATIGTKDEPRIREDSQTTAQFVKDVREPVEILFGTKGVVVICVVILVVLFGIGTFMNEHFGWISRIFGK